MSIDPLLLAEGGLAEARRDPLKWFRFAVEKHRRCVGYLHAGLELYIRSGNQGAKTHFGSRVAVALMRGEASLDGEALPVLETPNTGGVLGKSYKQMGASTIKALLEAIGDWPHKVESGSQGTVLGLRVRPNRSRSDDPKDWSQALMLPQDGEKPVGMRLDWAWGDEPPKEDYWHELRARGRRNRRFVRWITMTPEDWREWAWLEREFAGCEEPGREGRVEVVTSVFDNRMLSKAHMRELEIQWARDPLLRARLFGEYVNLVGQCPFNRDGVVRWKARCRQSERIESMACVPGWEPFEVSEWFGVERGEGYMVLADPSAGIRDEKLEHDPAGVIVVSRTGRKVVARWNGYAPADYVGKLSRALAEKWNGALVVWECNSGYGLPFYLGLGGYGNVYVDSRPDSLHLSLMDRLGWTTTAASRGAIVGALQKAVIEDSLVVLSGEMVASMSQFVMQRTGKYETGAGRHDEDVILMGLAAHLLETLPFYRMTESDGERFEREVLKIERVRERDDDSRWLEV